MNASPLPDSITSRADRAAIIALAILLALLTPAATRAQGPTAIDVQYFRISLQGDSVLMEWRTGTEIDTGGFQVWRSDIPNDPAGGVLVEEFAPQGDTAGFTYQYTDTGVLPGRTYYYTLVAYDLNSEETPFPSEPPGITIPGAQQDAPTSTPTQQAVATATPPGSELQPVTPDASGAFVTSTPTFTPFPAFTPSSTQAPLTLPATPVPPAVIPATPTPEPVANPTATPVPAGLAEPAAPFQPPQPPQAPPVVSTATPVMLAQAPAATTPAPLTSARPPTRSPRPTAPPAPAESNPQAILGVIALGSMLTALLLAGLMVLLWVRWRSGG